MAHRTIRRLGERSVARWLPPDSGDAAGSGLRSHKEAERGYEEGHAKGYADGRNAAQAELRAEIDQLSQICRSARRPLEDLSEQVEDELCRLSLCIARQVIRRELHSDPDQIAALVREARKLLGNVEGSLCIGVHPDDAPVVRRMFTDDAALSTVTVEEDPNISRGGCTLSSDVSFVDATVETRIARIAVQLLGDERELDDAPRIRGAEADDDGDDEAGAASFDMVLK